MENYPGFETHFEDSELDLDVSVNLIVQSHLSDALVEIANHQEDTAYNRIKFVKHLLHLQSTNKIGSRISEERLNRMWNETVNS